LFLRSQGADDLVATIAAEGWGGDRVIALAKPDDGKPEHAIAIARFEWDSEPDAIEAHEAAVKALDNAIVGGTVEHGESRTRWLAFDGTATIAERRGTSIVIAHGVPVPLLDAVQGELWTVTATKK
jgi:hypothetical protein